MKNKDSYKCNSWHTILVFCIYYWSTMFAETQIQYKSNHVLLLRIIIGKLGMYMTIWFSQALIVDLILNAQYIMSNTSKFNCVYEKC